VSYMALFIELLTLCLHLDGDSDEEGGTGANKKRSKNKGADTGDASNQRAGRDEGADGRPSGDVDLDARNSGEQDDDDEDEEEEELDMMAVLGFGGFDTTKGKEIADNTHGAVSKSKKRIYRQYMNRRGMCKRLLPGTHVFPIVVSCCVFDRWFQ
jgi:U4/U6.U5 tri-snRNP-associated protein 3